MLGNKKTFFITLLLFTIVIGFLPFGKFNIIVQLLFVSIGITSVSGIIFTKNNGHGYSLNTVYWLFNYTFFFIAPIIQFKYNTVFQGDILIRNQLYINTGLIILGASILYFFSYNFSYDSFKVIKFKVFGPISSRLLLYLSITASFLFLYLIKFNYQVVLYRPPSGWLKLNTLYGNLGYAIVSVIRYIPFFCMILYLLSKAKRKSVILILLALTLIVTFPISLSRGILAGLYLPLLILFFPIFNKKYYFLGLFFISIIVFFPLANSFRDMTNSGFNLSYSLFNTPHFDAFQNFMLLVNEKIVTNGKQLFDAFFFLKENRIGSGHILGEQVGFTFFNIAIPFLGEGFINFSYLGVVFFTIFIALFNSFFDKNYNSFPIAFKSIYLVLIGFEFYILRGDLSSSVKKMSGFIFALLIVVFSSYIFKKLNKKRG